MLSYVCYDLLSNIYTSLRLRNGVSKMRQNISFGWEEAYIEAKEAPILLPQRHILPILYFFRTYWTTDLMSLTYFSPYVKYCPSLFPHAAKSNAMRLNDWFRSWAAYILCPPFPCKYIIVGKFSKSLGNTMQERRSKSSFITVNT